MESPIIALSRALSPVEVRKKGNAVGGSFSCAYRFGPARSARHPRERSDESACAVRADKRPSSELECLDLARSNKREQAGPADPERCRSLGDGKVLWLLYVHSGSPE
jgi:hypothetical protein